MILTDVPAVVAVAGTATPIVGGKKVSAEDPDKKRAREKVRLMKEQARQKIAQKEEEAAIAKSSPSSTNQQKHSLDINSDLKRSSAERAEQLTPAEQKEHDREMIEKYRDTDKTKWEILENRAMSPVIMMEGERKYGHKQGLSVGIVLDSA
jgi:hypothetical protein